MEISAEPDWEVYQVAVERFPLDPSRTLMRLEIELLDDKYYPLFYGSTVESAIGH